METQGRTPLHDMTRTNSDDEDCDVVYVTAKPSLLGIPIEIRCIILSYVVGGMCVDLCPCLLLAGYASCKCRTCGFWRGDGDSPGHFATPWPAWAVLSIHRQVKAEVQHLNLLNSITYGVCGILCFQALLIRARETHATVRYVSVHLRVNDPAIRPVELVLVSKEDMDYFEEGVLAVAREEQRICRILKRETRDDAHGSLAVFDVELGVQRSGRRWTGAVERPLGG